ncbi:unnamed protein product [Rangifer tarandus platyrhynchus]|uniref:Secreted protein n=1 Tax=Rangifer tarandus platyrhynchus TaxID=3082113 RepID=A0ABN8YPC1_RANTA|nr:unnamed protein product [Rangifer tarandus platyrhynchus]
MRACCRVWPSLAFLQFALHREDGASGQKGPAEVLSFTKLAQDSHSLARRTSWARFAVHAGAPWERSLCRQPLPFFSAQEVLSSTPYQLREFLNLCLSSTLVMEALHHRCSQRRLRQFEWPGLFGSRLSASLLLGWSYVQ